MKRAKKAVITYSKVISYSSSYTCPHCHTVFVGAGIARNVTRFTCGRCENEIIVIDNQFKFKDNDIRDKS
jgi:transcription elongation factor Elf1